MSARAMTLCETQRAMAEAVMMPLTADEQMRAQAADGRAMADVAATFVAPNSRLTAFERLEIYNRQYWFRVLGALAEDFQALRSVVGSRRFHDLSVAYLTRYPSRSFTLRNLGSQMVEWLEAHPEYSGRRHAIAADVARIEWAFVEAFDNAEDTPLTLEQIATLDGGSRLALQPHVRLVELKYPADEFVIGLHGREKRQTSEAGVEMEEVEEAPVSLRGLRRRATWVAAHRVDLSVYYRRLEREEYRTLKAIGEDRTLAEALVAGFEESTMEAVRRAVRVKEWFRTWAELGWVCAPDLESLVKG